MTSVEQEIWNIFTFYTLHGNPLDPEHIRCTQFVKLCRDCQIVGSSLSEADPPLSDADVQVSYTAEVKRADKGGLQKMNYNDFLTVLMKLAIKVYPRSKTVDDAFQRLLMDNVLPLASRRCPDNVDMFLENGDVQRLYDYYSDALEQIFSFYATSDKRTSRALMTQAIASGSVTSAFASTGSLTVSGKSPARATRTVNTMKEALGYAEFLKFATDFDLSSSVILSTLEIGDIYLSSIKAVEPDSTIRKLTFLEFWEALVRCALVAYSKISDATIIDKIRGLFLYMWRSINKSVPRAFSERRNVSTYAGDLLSGAMLFNKRFTAQWSADGYRDYLGPESVPLESGKAVLSRLLKPRPGDAAAGSMTPTAAGGAAAAGGGAPMALLHPGGTPAAAAAAAAAAAGIPLTPSSAGASGSSSAAPSSALSSSAGYRGGVASGRYGVDSAVAASGGAASAAAAAADATTLLQQAYAAQQAAAAAAAAAAAMGGPSGGPTAASIYDGYLSMPPTGSGGAFSSAPAPSGGYGGGGYGYTTYGGGGGGASAYPVAAPLAPPPAAAPPKLPSSSIYGYPAGLGPSGAVTYGGASASAGGGAAPDRAAPVAPSPYDAIYSYGGGGGGGGAGDYGY